jgi:nucleotide-binding universal stress UspA family protein
LSIPGEQRPGSEEEYVPDLVMVATDGGRAAGSALRIAAAYAEAEGALIEVIAVVEPLSELPMPLPHRDELEQAHSRGMAERVRAQLRDVIGPTSWPVHVRLGRPAPAIFEAATSRQASLVILGLDGRKPEGNSTAVELLHLADVPVLVAQDGKVPRTAVVGVDFRPSSLAAARASLRLIGPSGTLHLVHIQPSLDFPAASVWDWSECYEGAVAVGFDRIIGQLGDAAATVTLRTHTRAGDPATELLAAADELDADLLAIGSDGYVCNGRAVVGRVARRLVVDPPIALLAMPVSSAANRTVEPLVSADAAAGPAVAAAT